MRFVDVIWLIGALIVAAVLMMMVLSMQGGGTCFTLTR